MANVQGFGCMGFSAFYASAATTNDESAKRVIQHVLSRGVTLLNTATFYGPLHTEGFGENLRLLKTCLEGVEREQVELMVKICMDTRAPIERPGTQWLLKCDQESIAKDVDYALDTLCTSYVDIIVLCRIPTDLSIEECVVGMKTMIDAGKARHIALSEVPSADVLRRAHAVHPIYCIEQEYSLWCRDIEQEILPVCRELGIKIMAYCPLGRGMLTSTLSDRTALPVTDYRVAHSPKFSEANFAHNFKLVQAAQEIADRNHISMAQVSLAWLYSKNKGGLEIVPIPGTTKVEHFEDNLGALDAQLSADDISELENIFTPTAVLGARY